MTFEEGVALLFHKLGDSKIMALGSSVNDYVMVRNVSCLFYDGKIYFKTDKNFRKTQQLYRNPQVALCTGGVQVEGIAVNKGLVVDEPGRRFEALYKKYLWQSYNAYSHEDTEILIEVTPRFVEIWDEDENRNAFQIFLDFDKKTVEIKPYGAVETHPVVIAGMLVIKCLQYFGGIVLTVFCLSPQKGKLVFQFCHSHIFLVIQVCLI